MLEKARSAASRGIQLSVKLHPGADPQGFVRRISSAPGVMSITQTFPSETDPELATMYVVELEAGALESAIRQLRSSPDVEYASDPAPRYLIR